MSDPASKTSSVTSSNSTQNSNDSDIQIIYERLAKDNDTSRSQNESVEQLDVSEHQLDVSEDQTDEIVKQLHESDNVSNDSDSELDFIDNQFDQSDQLDESENDELKRELTPTEIHNYSVAEIRRRYLTAFALERSNQRAERRYRPRNIPPYIKIFYTCSKCRESTEYVDLTRDSQEEDMEIIDRESPPHSNEEINGNGDDENSSE